jgi:hypothetical protein
MGTILIEACGVEPADAGLMALCRTECRFR